MAKTIPEIIAEFKAIEIECQKRQTEIVWQLSRFMTKTEIAEQLGIDRATLYRKYFNK